MERINSERIRIIFPGIKYKIVGCQAISRLKPFSKAICTNKCLQMLSQLPMGIVVIPISRSFFDCFVHGFYLTIIPWVCRHC